MTRQHLIFSVIEQQLPLKKKSGTKKLKQTSLRKKILLQPEHILSNTILIVIETE